MSFALITDRSKDTPLLTIRKQSSRSIAASREHHEQFVERNSATLQSAAGVDSAPGPIEETIPFLSASEEAAAYANGIRESLYLPDSAEVLLAIVWISDDERRFLAMFPEVFAVNVTEQTNKEKRPCIKLAAVNGENQTFTGVEGFLPSCCKWVFDWFFGTALPGLLPERVRLRNRLLLTDGDVNEYDAFLQPTKSLPQ
jgi:hypothetical protein